MTYEEAKQRITPGIYRHFKRSKYQVIGVARHSETQEAMVVYKALYGDGDLWIRPAEMWLEQVGEQGEQARFEREDNADKPGEGCEGL